MEYKIDDINVKSLPKRKKKRKRGDQNNHNEEDKKLLSNIIPELRIIQYEYLDHTADVQIHSWGVNIEEAFEHAVIGMFGYMTDLDLVECINSCTSEIEAKAHDLQSLLFTFMDECLYSFSTTDIIFKDIRIKSFDRENWTIKAIGYGEKMNLQKHTQGTEVKAITYSNMQIIENDKETSKQFQVYVIIDI